MLHRKRTTGKRYLRRQARAGHQAKVIVGCYVRRPGRAGAGQGKIT